MSQILVSFSLSLLLSLDLNLPSWRELTEFLPMRSPELASLRSLLMAQHHSTSYLDRKRSQLSFILNL